ncbi:hypothetical protein AAT17_07090 [Nonlabens sp. MIC269]|uniref:phage integrase SAM-like domain-containing protein n=1 Tax=Nonlabens sp. MIC269 TaxID=1476901 RepID=UPI000720DFC1|nr:tyrosine-type recombinase/integrase [Nonlabens sp. MIC269]ALM21003.1 hypothetical protein AAT17_07090 [Nonlabens sp. MIC269]
MASVNFLYRSTKDIANLNLRLLFRYNGKDYVFGVKTKFEVSKHYWTKQHRKRSKDIEITNQQTETNTELNKIENYILKAFSSINPSEVNKDWLQTQIDNYYNPQKQDKNVPTNLINYIDFYVKYRQHEIKETSKRKYNVIKHKLQRFEKERKKQILIKDVNESFKNEFVNFQKKEMYAQNTMQKEIAIIKTFCKHARFLGLETSPQLDDLKLEKEKVDKVYLTLSDIEKIENISKDKLTESLENAKDWLIISCYSGQRVSDFLRFTDKQIRIEDGRHLIEFTQKKTGKNMTVPLHPKILEILGKRNGKFPYRISDQKYNDYIKKVCKLAKLNDLTKGSKILETEPKSGIYRKKQGIYPKWELVTSHIGRRSFATNFYGIIPTTYLIYITGHSTETMFLNYIGKSNKDLALEITNYF